MGNFPQETKPRDSLGMGIVGGLTKARELQRPGE